jgi:hypothetical protein
MIDIQRKDQENFKAFQEKLPELKKLRGKYFLMRHGKIITYYNSYNDAYSTGAAVYADREFSVFLLKGPKETTKKKPERKAISKKKPGKRAALAAKHMPTKYDVPGYDQNYPDQSSTHFEVVCSGDHLRIRPFYTGPGARRWECLMAELVWTTIYTGDKARTGWFNGYRLTDPWCT